MRVEESIAIARDMLNGLLNEAKLVENNRKADGGQIDPLEMTIIYGCAVFLAEYIASASGDYRDKINAEAIAAIGDSHKQEAMSHSFYGFDIFLRKSINETVDKSRQETDSVKSLVGLIEAHGAAKVLATMTGKPADYSLMNTIDELCKIGMLDISNGPPKDGSKVNLD